MSSNSLSKHILYEQQHYGFQHLFLEYYAYLFNGNEQITHKLLEQGLSYNLEAAQFSPDALQALQYELEQPVASILSSKQALNDAFAAFYHTPHSESKSNPLSLHSQLQEQIQKGRFYGITALVEKLKQALEVDPFDYWIEHSLAWIYFHLIQDMHQAEFHFIRAANNSTFDKTPLTAITQRYLAFTKLMLDNKSDALAHINIAIKQHPSPTPQQIFEIAQCEDFTTDSHHHSKELKEAVEASPLYYIQIQSDALLRQSPKVQSLLSAIYSAKLMQIHELAQHKWKASSIYTYDLPGEIDKQALFNETFKQYREILSHQPYPVLCKTEEISDKILAKVSVRTKQKLSFVQTSYTKKIININKKWQAINKLGGGLVYVASILGFSSVLLFISFLLLGEMIVIPMIQWEQVIPIFFMLILVLTLIGLLLLRFTPQASRDLSQKKASITDALNPKSI